MITERHFKMKKTTAVVASCVALMSCGSGESIDGDVPTPVVSGQRNNVTADGREFVGRNTVQGIAYNSATQILTIKGDPFDSAGTFRRAPTRDVEGFMAFENDAGARDYLAFVGVDTVHGLTAGVVGTPFQFDNEFGGTALERDRRPTLPTNREVRHLGDYAGVRNEGTNNGVDMSNSFLHRVEGQVELNLDFFADRQTPSVEGAISNRRNMDVDGVTYADIVLQFTGIDENGNFSGIAAVGGQPVGLYDGMIAGNNAAASAGIVVIQDGSPVSLERGAFIARATD
ncbi:MAG: hypothetical protein ACNA7L_01735 [Roseinatronobacter sp.]